MGCDIHIWVELQDTKGEWSIVPRPEDLIYCPFDEEDCCDGDLFKNLVGRPNKTEVSRYENLVLKLGIPLPFNLDDFLEDKEDCKGCYSFAKWWNSDHPLLILEKRRYCLFSVLANVRNYMESRLLPISPPRGVPSDASKDYLRFVKEWKGDGHSHSYHTLKQLLEFNWDREVEYSGVVTPGVFSHWIKFGKENKQNSPIYYSRNTSGPCARMISFDEMLKFVTESGILDRSCNTEDDTFWGVEGVPPDGQYLYTRVYWGESYKESVGPFYSKVIPWLVEMSLPPERVRIVFFFDN